MFVVYGDPKSSDPPILSARTASGHSPPATLSSASSTTDPDVRIISSAWQRPSPYSNYSRSTYIASITFVCSDCYNWTGTSIRPMSANQSWIWAWNEDQVITEFWDGTTLAPHSHGTNSNGAGTFDFDMRLPPLEEEMGRVDTVPPSNSPLDASKDNNGSWFPTSTVWTVHGLMLGFTFLILFPAGTVAIRTKSDGAFTYHWVLQLLATSSTTAGAAIGFIMQPRLYSPHHIIGVSILILIWFQALLGWRHHMRFLKVFRQTWISVVHTLLGRLILLCGCANVLLGMSLRGREQFFIELLFVVIVFDLTGVGYWVLSAGEKAPKKSVAPNFESLRDTDCFAIGPDDDGEDYDDDGGEVNWVA